MRTFLNTPRARTAAGLLVLVLDAPEDTPHA